MGYRNVPRKRKQLLFELELLLSKKNKRGNYKCSKELKRRNKSGRKKFLRQARDHMVTIEPNLL